MLKTLERNWIAREVQIYWKRLEAWGTALKIKYKQDLFFQTECKVIFLQAICAVSFIIFVSIAFNYLYQSITETLLAGISASISHSGSISAKDIVDSLAGIKMRNFVLLIVITSIITILFGYLIVKVSFAPACNALELQKRFVEDIAHELRTPLSIIKTNSEVALLNQSISMEMKGIHKSNIEE